MVQERGSLKACKIRGLKGGKEAILTEFDKNAIAILTRTEDYYEPSFVYSVKNVSVLD